jgi:transglutaminase-like putative cysteine protease
MAWRMGVVHHTTYNYESEVRASFNELRMTPLTDEHQILIQHRTSISPTAPLFTYQDYWGTTVHSFDLQTPHMTLAVVVENLVDSYPVTPESPAPFAQWGDLTQPAVLDDLCEYLPLTRLTDPIAHEIDVRTYASPLEAVYAVCEAIRARVKYSPGATHVYTPASEAWANAEGVCQDYTNIALSILRSAGIPARYVSGYLYSGSGEIGDTIVGESHSWIEAWVGFWMPVDPTNGREVGEQHIAVAKGRDYHDVSPMSGVFTGGRSREIHVEVKLTRLPR